MLEGNTLAVSAAYRGLRNRFSLSGSISPPLESYTDGMSTQCWKRTGRSGMSISKGRTVRRYCWGVQEKGHTEICVPPAVTCSQVTANASQMLRRDRKCRKCHADLRRGMYRGKYVKCSVCCRPTVNTASMLVITFYMPNDQMWQ
jgi:hypothetical protein